MLTSTNLERALSATITVGLQTVNVSALAGGKARP
jgi:hypothetical protein